MKDGLILMPYKEMLDKFGRRVFKKMRASFSCTRKNENRIRCTSNRLIIPLLEKRKILISSSFAERASGSLRYGKQLFFQLPSETGMKILRIMITGKSFELELTLL